MADYQVVDSPDAPWNQPDEPEMMECKECKEQVTPLSHLNPFVDSCADHLDLNNTVDRGIFLDQYVRNYEELIKLKARIKELEGKILNARLGLVVLSEQMEATNG